MSTFKRLLLASIVGAAVGAPGVLALIAADGGFPHAEHEGLFPLCSTCHSGITSEADGDVYPAPQSCASCHDGEREDRVEWAGPSRLASNLEFSHTEHEQAALREGDSLACQSCHGVAGDSIRMAVDRADPQTCLSCHAHEAPEHFQEERDCLACHVPLAQASELTVGQIQGLSKPESHEALGFVQSHGGELDASLQSCAFCHTQDSCARCHFNGAQIPAIAALEPDARVATLTSDLEPHYPLPTTHETASWDWEHGDGAGTSVTSCGNCHTQPSCEACHAEGTNSTIESLPLLADDDDRGVQVSAMPTQVHDVGFSVSHGAAAASMESTCAGCHAEAFCSSCHQGSSAPAFHIGNFLQGHGPEAYSNQSECASCHNTETFCRTCHSDVGLGSSGRLTTAFHSSRPAWLLGHGEAARQGLESCATCHRQTDCMRCHAAVGAWRINPHGSGFDPTRMRDVNPTMCGACHRTGIPE